jgi:Cu/Ag efflux pump CusA
MMSAMAGIWALFGGLLESLAGQIGPKFDPLFYDVMIYIVGTMMFSIFLLSVIAFWVRRRGIGAREAWVAELEKYYEREGVGLMPEERRV